MKDFQVLVFCSNAIVSTCAACSGEKADDMYFTKPSTPKIIVKRMLFILSIKMATLKAMAMYFAIIVLSDNQLADNPCNQSNRNHDPI